MRKNGTEYAILAKEILKEYGINVYHSSKEVSSIQGHKFVYHLFMYIDILEDAGKVVSRLSVYEDGSVSIETEDFGIWNKAIMMMIEEIHSEITFCRLLQ